MFLTFLLYQIILKKFISHSTSPIQSTNDINKATDVYKQTHENHTEDKNSQTKSLHFKYLLKPKTITIFTNEMNEDTRNSIRILDEIKAEYYVYDASKGQLSHDDLRELAVSTKWDQYPIIFVDKMPLKGFKD